MLISPEPIDAGSVPYSNHSGAIIEFHGVVRSQENHIEIAGINYECFEAMAYKEFVRIFRDTLEKWPIHSICLHHRTGPVKAGEPSLYVRVSAGHRAEAFSACQWMIDEMKRSVPIWKKAFE